VLNIGVDLRLVNSTTQEVVESVSYQKQILGYENEGAVGAGKSRKILSLTGGGSAIEPVQAGVRALIELGVYQLADYVYAGDRGSGCMEDSGQKYSAADNAQQPYVAMASNDARAMPNYGGQNYAAPLPQNRDVNSAPAQYPTRYQGLHADNGAPVYQAEAAPQPQYQEQYQPQNQAQNQGQYETQAQPQYAPQYQGQYQDQPPAQLQGQDLPRYLRDSWRR
jgi:Curli production assembly/transport component CsgG